MDLLYDGRSDAITHDGWPPPAAGRRVRLHPILTLARKPKNLRVSTLLQNANPNTSNKTIKQ